MDGAGDAECDDYPNRAGSSAISAEWEDVDESVRRSYYHDSEPLMPPRDPPAL